ncbi:hypothetical protein GF377_09795 [candidate division GN15 bacterium]|nr:hypothetical protein [candidate division GN15 bacterium]
MPSAADLPRRAVIADSTSTVMRQFADIVLRSVRIVGSSHILPYEEPVATDGADCSRIDERATVRHPFPVVRRGRDYLLLDDTATFASIIRRGVRHVPVQQFAEDVVQPLARELTVVGFTHADLMTIAERHADQCRLLKAGEERPVEGRSILAAFDDREPVALQFRQDQDGCPQVVASLFAAICEQGRYAARCAPWSRPETPFKIADPGCWLSLPDFDIDDLWAAAKSEQRFPSGLIDVRLAGRILNVDFPVSVLESSLPREEKDAFLHDLVLFRQQASRTSVLDGPVYMLNR